jgi:transposase InsO family protein
MCREIGVSRSGYYGWRKQPQGKRRNENDKLLLSIKESYRKNRGNYGSPRITDELRDQGFCCGKNRVARIMKANGIVAKTKKKFKATTNSKHNLPVAENLLKQDFTSPGPNAIWVSDVTYIWTNEGWLYLSMILDLFSRQVVGWAMSDRLTADFVIRSLYQAIGRRRPPPGCIFHSDRGVQYARYRFSRSPETLWVSSEHEQEG